MTEHAAPSTTWRHTQPRRVRSAVVDDHGRPRVPRPPAVDQTQFLDDTAQVDDVVAPTGRHRAVRVVGLYALTASALLAAAVLGAAATGTSPLAVVIPVGLVFVAGSSVVLWQILRRWASRIAAAAEVQRQAAQDRDEVTRIRAAFLGSISHELRTPLTNILGFAQTIHAHHRTLGPERIEQFSDRLAANTTRLEQLVLDLLDLHRDGIDEDTDVEPVHVEQVLHAAVAATGPRSQRLHVWSPVEWVEVERAKLERIVVELVGNVVRHTPPDTVAWLQATTDNGELHLGIEDDGPGVDPEIIDQVSQPFIQGDEARHSPSPGLGIGLALAARYAEQLGGELTIRRPTTGGTRVDVVLPDVRVTSRSDS